MQYGEKGLFPSKGPPHSNQTKTLSC